MSETKFIANESKTLSANEGHISLKWQGEPQFTLITSRTKTFSESKTLYGGSDTGFFMTGLKEGEHYFKVSGGKGISDVVLVNVDYPSEGLVMGSLLVGLALFLSLCVIIIKGNKQSE